MDAIKATVKEITYNGDGTANLIFTVSAPDCKTVKGFIERTANSRKTEDFAAKSPFAIKIEKWRERRSSNANSYMWQLLEKIAIALSRDKTVYTSVDMYRKAIREVGVWQDVKIENKAVNTVRYSWSLNGKGYLSEIIEKSQDYTTVRMYYGSSRYNTKQMSRLIDYVVADAESLGIDTKTPNELAEIMSLWEAQTAQ